MNVCVFSFTLIFGVLLISLYTNVKYVNLRHLVFQLHTMNAAPDNFYQPPSPNPPISPTTYIRYDSGVRPKAIALTGTSGGLKHFFRKYKNNNY